MLRALQIPISWTELFKRTAKEFSADNCLGLAAELAYTFCSRSCLPSSSSSRS